MVESPPADAGDVAQFLVLEDRKEDPTFGATEPWGHNCCLCAQEPMSHNY